MSQRKEDKQRDMSRWKGRMLRGYEPKEGRTLRGYEPKEGRKKEGWMDVEITK
ncbi:hypothetical protein BY996DRAFT_6510936 [Phakopsora pachyrhizi]|uniref:Uncharacterized protein n=1 Tax=Phakopsora pachyrhizi TaxID=170000 RepID=A0AAV0B6H2_PHAPC|nr:hypothetical protein BY996DRAFT_6510936 [Phakopsora pachyrhizi]CAH7682606.1 hypothetical protein PPACK8108_LOCUS15594 [Phakopsora pachyrhizi]